MVCIIDTGITESVVNQSELTSSLNAAESLCSGVYGMWELSYRWIES